MANIKPYNNQVYKLLYEKHNKNRLFVDPEFPACLNSISHTGHLGVMDKNGENILKHIEWLRPHEMVDRPSFHIDGFERRDLGQGQLGNCWFVAAAGALTLNPELLAHVIPGKQTFHQDEYAGIFHFRFWLFGEWVDVVIDDRLPCYKGELVFCQNKKNRVELWAPLLEKAYAKVWGSYKIMEGGNITDALVDFTGGIDESIMLNIQSPPPGFKEEIKCLLQQACEKTFFVGCSVIATNDSDSGCLPNGLVTGHAFSVTHMEELTTPNGIITLVRCLNPWNDSTEWNRDWSDNSPLWDDVSDEEKRRIKFRQSHDGEFWMAYDDFFTNFHELQICHSKPGSLGLLQFAPLTTHPRQVAELTWHEEVFHGEWIKEESAGGSGLQKQPPENYWTNPQYLVKLEFNDDGVEEKLCTMIITLMFKEERQRILSGQESICIAFDVYKVKNDTNISKHIKGHEKFYMTDLDQISSSGEHTFYRSASKRLKVRPGTYIIIPNTFYYGQSGKFFLRIFTETAANQTAATELTINKKNLTGSKIKRPQANVQEESDDSDDQENNNEDSDDQENNNEDSDDQENNNEDSDDQENNNEDSDDQENNNEDSDDQENNNEDSDDQENNNEDSDDQENNNEDSDDQENNSEDDTEVSDEGNDE